MSKFFNFLLCFLPAFFCALLTYLFTNECCAGCITGSLFAGIWSGACVATAYEVGKNDWTKASLVSYLAGVLGGICGGILFAFPG